MKTVAAILLSSLSLIDFGNAQSCLASPPELSWSNNVGSMTFGSATFTRNGVTFTTRVHDGMFPSPTLRMQRGQTYTLTLHNALTDINPNPTMNVIKELDYTNIHTHGVHITGEEPGDSVFVRVDPLSSHTYTYHLPCDHVGGTHWYHPHHHGSTAVQVGGGAAGALIIDDSAEEKAFYPAWYNDLASNELIMVIQNMDLGKVASLGGSLDNTFTTSSNTAFYTVNGEYQPTICLETNIYRKFRMVHVDIASAATFEVNSASCEVQLLAKDGVLLDTVPRQIASRQMYFTVASRADVAVRCTAAGTYTLVQGSTVVAYINVADGSSTPQTLTEFSTAAARPYYLQDLQNYNGVYGTQNIRMSARTVNGKSFSAHDNYLFTISADSVNEWSLSGAGAHPFHVHVNHFQVLSGSMGPTGWTEAGDWHDVWQAPGGTVRFRADRFGGHVVIHCHILEHEDEGAMGVYQIDGGCNGEKGNYGSGSPACDWSCTSPTTQVPTQPTSPPVTPAPTTTTPAPVAPPTTPAPTQACDASGSSCNNPGQCCSGVCSGAGPNRSCQ
mmetsp:Transcript_29730/g.47379  ORF Transcript_29730/g.47379 Transcript_29730/m.47379 type:complete len:556 (-) Transcript_29730:174-1841(-)